MALVRWLSALIVRVLCRILFRIHVVGLEHVPLEGALIIASNHVNFFDAPILFTAFPRRVIPLVKQETWDHPFLGTIMRAWSGIPVRRGELYLDAFRQSIAVLRQEKALGIAMEGTRSHHGRLQRGRPGVVALTAHAPNVRIVPVAVNGLEKLYPNLRRFRRTWITVVFGRGFSICVTERRMSQELRQEIADEIMAQIASLMPEEYRGVYAGRDAALAPHLSFVTPVSGGTPRHQPA